MIKIDELVQKSVKKDRSLSYAIIICVVFFIITYIISRFVNIIFSENTYLTIHFLVEVLSILVSFCIFTLLYFTYDIFHNLRNILLANTFLIIGFIDIFHVLSYDGMPLFFTANNPQKATAFWIIARLIMSLGFFVCSIIPIKKKTTIDKESLLVGSIFIISLTWYVVVYKPGLVPTLFAKGQGLTTTKVVLEYAVIIFQALAIYFLQKDYNRKRNSLMMTFMTAIVISIFSELAFTLYISVIDIFNLLGHFFKILSYFLMFRALFIANVRRPYRKLAEVRNKLNEHAMDLENRVEVKTQKLVIANEKLLEANEKLVADLEAGKHIQEALLPTESLHLDQVDFYSKYFPCEKLSGDLYNYFKIDDENIGMYIVDVSGHGLSAAMLTVFASRSLTGIVNNYLSKDATFSPKEILSSFYDIYNKSNFPNETYLVMVYGIYNTKTNTFTYSSAGHNCPPILISEENGVRVLDTTNGFPICKLGSVYNNEYKDYEIKLSHGDKMLFYTDGITELKNKNHDMYSIERLTSCVRKNQFSSSKELIKKIEDQITDFSSSIDIDDDITYFIMEVNEKTV